MASANFRLISLQLAEIAKLISILFRLSIEPLSAVDMSKTILKNAKAKRVLVLLHPDLIPPEKATKEVLDKAIWRAEFDVIRTLKRMGHSVFIQGVYDDLTVIRKAVDSFKPHVAFNLLEEFNGEATFDQNVVSYLELLGVPYTGCNPRGLMLARHKDLAKKVLTYHNISTPEFQIFPVSQGYRKPDIEFPLFVKSTTEEASFGITHASIVRTEKALKERVRFINEEVGTDAIAERYIEGRELYVGVLGNVKMDLFPVWELVFRKISERTPRIATTKVKFDPEYRKKYGITSLRARLPETTITRVHKMSRQVYQILGLTGFARLDFRLEKSGRIYFLEANPNPHVGEDEDFAQSALKAGISYPELLDRILRLGIRWQTSRIAS